MSARTHTPDRVWINEEGRKVTTIKLKRACNGCGQLLGDADDRDVDEHGDLADVRAECTHCRPLVEAEAAGARTWQVTRRSIAEVDDDLDQLGVFAKGYWQFVDGKNTVVGLRVGSGEARVVARWDDWLIRHPDGHFTVLAAPRAES
ncbi:MULTISPECIES: hypothetical protein [unclassified Streptomyces]|uniref:hypothetical protein n=1 Tax=unclassified Streptomyces TaxID=2593676 RepID=UPI00081F659B|nr:MULTISPECIES: hypothetical protein [unclassified Streptomyces]MYR30541.1 hypothetical protein [Streptomyces sp. SID4945]SCF50071.1 hypothetical protein GA0115257_123718 [Streptomyces sp. LcepLS]